MRTLLAMSNNCNTKTSSNQPARNMVDMVAVGSTTSSLWEPANLRTRPVSVSPLRRVPGILFCLRAFRGSLLDTRKMPP